MHHKRKSKRRDKRVMARCGCCTLFGSPYEPYKQPIADGPCNGRKMSKRKSTPKERCPVNGSHDWVREWQVETITEYDYKPLSGYWNCDECRALRKAVEEKYGWWGSSRHPIYCRDHVVVRTYEVRERLALCVECGKEKVEKTTSTRNWDRKQSWRGMKSLKKRPVQLY